MESQACFLCCELERECVCMPVSVYLGEISNETCTLAAVGWRHQAWDKKSFTEKEILPKPEKRVGDLSRQKKRMHRKDKLFDALCVGMWRNRG